MTMSDDGFPRGLRDFVDATAVDELDARVQSMLEDLDEFEAAPRDIDLVCDFLVQRLPPSRLCIYGVSGRQTAAIVERLTRERSDISIVGFLDRRAAEIGPAFDRPVYTPEQVHEVDADLVLLSHENRERTLVETLLGLGYAATRVVQVYGDPSFREMARNVWRARLKEALPEPKQFCIITTADLERNLIPECVLSGIMPLDQTVKLLFGRKEWFMPLPGYATFDTLHGLDLLRDSLRQLSPELVYLRTTPHVDGEYLAPVIREALPNATLIQEVSDWGVLFTPERLARMGFDATDVARIRLGELYTCSRTDLVVHKNGGAPWDRMAADFTAPHAAYFPVVPIEDRALPAPHVRKAGDPVRILFAGSFLPPAFISTHPDLDYIPLFEAVTSDGDVTIDIYNAGDQTETTAELYQTYRDRFRDPDGAIRYHRGVPLEVIVDRAADFDIGWHVNNHAAEHTFERITAVGIGNKMGTYVWAGLPLIVDDKYALMADLVRGFDAGPVISAHDVGRIAETLRCGDWLRWQNGVRRLRSHLIDANRAVVGRIEQLAAAPNSPA